MKITATSDSGKIIERNSKKNFKYGFFAFNSHYCKCLNNLCKQGVLVNYGFSNAETKSFEKCPNMKLEIERVNTKIMR